MPKDSWRSANLRASHGPVRRTGSDKPGKKRKRAQVKGKVVSIGTCSVLATTDKAVHLCIPSGKHIWAPRTVLINGNMRFKVGQILEIQARNWWAAREGIKASEQPKPNPQTHNDYPTEAQF